jgi:hypothetical protein
VWQVLSTSVWHFFVPATFSSGDPTKDLKAIKTIRMVVNDGTFYHPAEVYPRFGIEPFVAAPRIEGAAPAS